MTREEAIEILWRYDVNFEPHPPEEVMHAIDMAIEALSADRPKNMIHIDDVYRLIAGHSDYHGDSILSAFTCLVEGKDVKPIAPLDESADRHTRLTNAEWKDFLSEQFGISKSSAREMLHGMMSVKREDNFKKRFNQRRGERREP